MVRDTKTVILTQLSGVQTFPIEYGVHTLTVDVRVQQQMGLADMIKNFANYYPKEAENLIAMALGYYEIPLEFFYEEVKDKTELNDHILAESFRWSARKTDELMNKKLDDTQKQHTL